MARDSKTSAILLYLENISDARRFLRLAQRLTQQAHSGDQKRPQPTGAAAAQQPAGA
ncbi:hypothetical protein M5585_08990 [Serratia ureilytica]